MSIRKRDVHFSDWTKVRHALVCNNVQGITETSSFDDVRAFLINSESGLNPFYYYVCYIKETKEIYTHGQFYAYSNSSFDDTELRDLIETKADLSALEALVSEVEENELVTAKALYDLNDRKLDKSELDNIDLSNYVDLETYNSDLDSINASITNKANQADLDALSAEVEENEEVTAAALVDLNEKIANMVPDTSGFATQDDVDVLESEIEKKADKFTLKTVNNESLLGSGNVSIATPDHYKNTATRSGSSGFVEDVTYNSDGHVATVSRRSLTSTDIPGLDASKITSGTIDIARLPKGALEQLHHYETQELAQQAVIDKAVQLGDTVQINHATMYICTNDSATTFATQFTEYVAGTAASVPWSGITGKPTGIDEWGNRIGVIESGYATQSWVGENYLPLSGGTLTGALTLGGTESTTAAIKFSRSGDNTWNYIIWPGSTSNDCKLAFGYDTNAQSSFYYMTSKAFYPTVTNTYSLGTSELKWSNIYATTFIGNLTGNADSATTVYLGNSNANGAFPIPFVSNKTAGNKSLFVSTTNTLIFNPSTGGLSAKSFIGNLTGNADSATKVNTYTTSAALHYPLLFGASADAAATMTNSLSSIYKNGVNNVYFIPSEGTLVAPKISATTFAGNLIGTAENAKCLGEITATRYALDHTEEYKDNINADNLLRVGFYSNVTGNGVGNSNFPYSYGRLFSWGDSYTRVQMHATSWGQLAFRSGAYSLEGVAWKYISFIDSDSLSPASGTLTVNGNITATGNITAQKFTGNLTGTASGNLPLTGGTLTGTTSIPLYIKSSHATEAAVGFGANNAKGYGYIVYKGGGSWAVTKEEWGAEYSILHTGNYSNLLAGGTVNGSLTATLLKSITGYTLTSVENESCGLMRNSAITTEGDSADIWLYNTKDIKYRASNHYFTSGNVAIGGKTADEKLHIHGNVKASGSMYATDFCTTSDNRLKDFTKDVIVDFNELKNIPKKYYYWKDKSMGEELQIGTSAQELAKVYPECVSYNEKEDRYSVSYQKLSIIALAAIDKLHERISVLEKKLNDQNS